MTLRPDFDLSKWYLDCVGEDGSVFIGYSARLRWNFLRLRYASVLTSGPIGEACREWILPCPEPAAESDDVRWRSRRIGIDAVWHRRAPAATADLLETERGRVTWACLQPASDASVRMREHAILRGSGYVERLEMTLPPGELPIRELRWGHFASGGDSVVWIDWRGPLPRSVVVRNGRCSEGRVGDASVELADGELRMGDPRVLREGRLVEMALSQIPGIRRIAPPALLDAHEAKWLSRATLSTSSGTGSGWAIHELIRFPQNGVSRRN